MGVGREIRAPRLMDGVSSVDLEEAGKYFMSLSPFSSSKEWG